MSDSAAGPAGVAAELVAAAAPALPWAAAPPSAVQQGAAQQQQDANATTEVLDVQIGDRIEVLWMVEPDEGDSYQRWWGATLQKAAGSSAQPADDAAVNTGSAAAGAQRWTLRYDPAPADGWEEAEEADVLLLAPHRLQDARSQERMWWRREGDEFEPPPAGDSGDEDYSSDDEALSDAEAAGEGGGRALSIQALAACITDDDLAASDARVEAATAGLDAAGRASMAAGYRDFVDGFKAFLAAKLATADGTEQAARGGPDQGGGELLITADDIAEFSAMIGAARRR